MGADQALRNEAIDLQTGWSSIDKYMNRSLQITTIGSESLLMPPEPLIMVGKLIGQVKDSSSFDVLSR